MNPFRKGSAVATAVLGVALAPVTAAHAATVSFAFTGAEQSFTVPADVTSIDVSATGAAGGGERGGRGATAAGTIAVTPGQVLYIEVGGPGAPDVGGFNGGGAGAGAFGGGGGTDVRTKPAGEGVASLASRLIAAGGGGGQGMATSYGAGGSGGSGGLDGTAGDPGPGYYSSMCGGGDGGTQTGGGLGTSFGASGDGVAGGGGAGSGGGGGGGGYFGGAGGDRPNETSGYCSGGGGGGGSSKVPSGGIARVADPGAAPGVTLTFSPRPAAPAPGPEIPGPPAAAPATPATPTAAKPSAPTLEGSGRVSVRREGGRFVVRVGRSVSCPASGPGCTYVARLTTRTGRRITLGTATGTLAAGATERLQVRLNALGTRRLLRVPRLAAGLTVSMRAGTSAAPTRRVALSLRRS